MGTRGPRTDLREQVLQLAQELRHGPSPNPAIREGTPNVSAIAEALGVSRQRVQQILAEATPPE